MRRERARAGGLPPQLIFGHAGFAITGLLAWVTFVVTGVKALAWAAVRLLMITACLGLSTVTPWTPYPACEPSERPVPAPWDEPAVVVPDTPAGAVDTPGPLDSLITDEMIAQLIEDSSGSRPHRPHRPIRLDPAVLVPVAHGFAAIGTFVFAVTTVAI